MKKYFLMSVKFTIILVILICVVYPAILLTFSFIAPNNAEGRLVVVGQEKVYMDISQNYCNPKYFHPRPSATNYDASSSGATNKGPFESDYLQKCDSIISLYRIENSYLSGMIPVDAVTSSGSGLDPHISIENARIQAIRISKARNVSNSTILKIIEQNTERSYFRKDIVNVNVLNLQLVSLK